MSARAGIVVTGTEVLTGIIADRNGPWLAERLLDLGVDIAHTTVVGDRPDDMERALRFLAAEGVDMIVTSGGLGPTADDLTAEVVGRFQGRAMVLDEALEERIAEILRPLMARWPNLDAGAVREANRKQAVIPEGSTVLAPVGTAPGLVVPPSGDAGATVVVLPGPPRELQPMWQEAIGTDAFRAAIPGAVEYRRAIMRLFGIPESEIVLTLREFESAGGSLAELEVTTCLRRGEIEIATRYEPKAEAIYRSFESLVRERHADTFFSSDETTVDGMVAALLRDGPTTIATAESCTGGGVAARLTDLPGSSAYVLGGLVVYSNEAKTALAGVDPALIEAHGAVSAEVARALAAGARGALGADLGAGITGIAGPDGGTEEKPVGLVYFCVQGPGAALEFNFALPGGRSDVRERASTVAMHMIRRLMQGETELRFG